MEYLVIFLNENGEELYRTTVKQGETAVYQGEIPQKENEVFAGWNKSIKDVQDNLIVTAVFEKPKDGSLTLGAISFVENEKEIHVIEQAVISNKDLHQEKEVENGPER